MFNSNEQKKHVFTTTHRQDEINDDLSMPRRNRVNPNPRRRRGDEYRRPNAFIAFILGLCAVVSICFFIGLLVIRTANVPHIIRQTDFVEILEVVAVGEHSYYIVDQINALPFHNAHVTLYDIDYFIRTDAVSNEIGLILGAYAAAFAAGNLDHHITADDLVASTRGLDPELQELFDHHMTDADHEALAMRLDDIIDFSSLSVSGLMYDYDMGMTIPRMFLSSSFLWTIGLISALFLMIIFLIRIRSVPDAMIAVGVPIALAGGIMYGIGLLLGSVPALFGYTAQRILSFLNGPVHLIMQYGLTFAIVGIVVVLVSLLIKMVTRRNYAH